MSIKLDEVLKDLVITEEQTKALMEFLVSFEEEVNAKSEAAIDAKVEAKLKEQEADKEGFWHESEVKEAFSKFHDDQVEKFSNTTIRAIQDIYEEIQVKVKEDFTHSPEYVAFTKIREAMSPVMISEENKKILKRAEEIEAKEKALLESEEKLKQQGIINKLLEDFPKEYVSTVRDFITEAINEEDIYKRFNMIVEMVDGNILKKEHTGPDREAIKKRLEEIKAKKEALVEDVKPAKVKEKIIAEDIKKKAESKAAQRKAFIENLKESRKTKKAVKPIMESVSAEEKPAEAKKKYSSLDDMIIDLAFTN